MATARELLKYLKSLPDKDLEAELSMRGHFGEHNAMELPAVIDTNKTWTSSKTIRVLQFPMVDVGPEPD